MSIIWLLHECQACCPHHLLCDGNYNRNYTQPCALLSWHAVHTGAPMQPHRSYAQREAAALQPADTLLLSLGVSEGKLIRMHNTVACAWSPHSHRPQPLTTPTHLLHAPLPPGIATQGAVTITVQNGQAVTERTAAAVAEWCRQGYSWADAKGCGKEGQSG